MPPGRLGTNIVRARLSGLHKATKRLSGGRVAIYAYAFRGGPLVVRAEGGSLVAANRAMEEALGQPGVSAKIEDARRPIRRTDDKRFVRGLIYAFKASPEWAKIAPSSQAEYTRYLTSFEGEFGEMTVAAFDHPEAKVALLEWRDQWAAKPRAADYAMQSVGRLFKWARGRGMTQARPTEDVERLYNADRSDVIWTASDLEKLLAVASREIGIAVRLAAETGLRMGDLINLPWGAVGDHGIVWRTSKRGRQVVVPLTPEAKAILSTMPKKALVVLTNSRGKPWTRDGFKTMFGKAKAEAGLTGLHFHDLRGTAATRLFIAGSPKRDIAKIMGWAEAAVDALLTKYVSGDAVALDLLSRMNQKPAAQTDDKPVSSGSS